MYNQSNFFFFMVSQVFFSVNQSMEAKEKVLFLMFCFRTDIITSVFDLIRHNIS